MKVLPDLPQEFSSTREFIEFIEPQYLSYNYGQKTVDLYQFMFINNGWMLTHKGAAFLKKYYNSYHTEHEDNIVINGKIVLYMNRLMKNPWRLNRFEVTLWNSTLYFELQLVNGKLLDFINFKM